MAAPSLHRLFSLWLIVFPSKCALFAVIFAGPLALAEETTFAKAFLYLVQVLTGASIPLTPWTPSGKALGIAIANSMGIIKQLILALHIGLTAGPMIEPVLDWEVGLWRCCVDGKLFVGRTNAGIYRKTAIFWLNTSLFCVVLSFAAGGILAVAEGWPYWNGVVLVLGEVTSSATVLPNQSKLGPDTTGGIIVGFIVGVLAAAILGIIIAVASVPLLGFDLKFDNTHAVRSKPAMLLTKEQQRRLGIELGASEKGTVKSGWMPDEGDNGKSRKKREAWSTAKDGSVESGQCSEGRQRPLEIGAYKGDAAGLRHSEIEVSLGGAASVPAPPLAPAEKARPVVRERLSNGPFVRDYSIPGVT